MWCLGMHKALLEISDKRQRTGGAAHTLLSVRGIKVVYPNGVVANDGVSLDVFRGEVLGVLGENGAGKTTLVKVISGVIRPLRGEIYVEGTRVVFKSPLDAMRAGIAMAPQHPQLFSNLTVVEDLGLTLKLVGKRVSYRLLKKEVKRISEEYGLDVAPEAPIWSLSMGERQRVELLRLILVDAKIMLLDEVTTHLSPLEVSRLRHLVRRLASEGRGIVFITHKLSEALGLCDRIVVMRKGRLVGSFDKRTMSQKAILEAMFGLRSGESEVLHINSTSKEVAKPQRARDDVILEVDDLWVKGRHGTWVLKGVKLRVARGAVVGVAGIAGNGQLEFFEVLVGLRKPDRGRILFNGVDVTRAPPTTRIRLGASFIPEERLGWGLVPGKDIVFNMALGNIASNGSIIKWGILKEKTLKAIESLGVKVGSLRDKVDSLSGGNMQRLILARELLRSPTLVVAMNPLAGLDYQASLSVKNTLIEASRRGTSILLFSEDLDELVEVSDYIYVMTRGRVKGPYNRPFDINAIAREMTE